MLRGQRSNGGRRVEQPIPVVSPVVDVVREVVRDTTAQRIDIRDMRRIEPLRRYGDALVHVADGSHMPTNMCWTCSILGNRLQVSPGLNTFRMSTQNYRFFLGILTPEFGEHPDYLTAV